MPSLDAPSRSQSASVSGADNVNVQIQGDNNVVHLGRSRLDLTLYRGRRRAVSSPAVEAGEAAEILSPYAMAVPLVGRERELADLWTWMNGDPDLSIRVITAPGGGGKTRLALELCEEAVRRGWHAGFVKASASLDSVAASLPRPTLAVVDYAAARISWLREWLDDLASSPLAGGKLRILLLERHADPKSGWWAEVFQSGGWGARAVQARLDPAGGPYKLPPLALIEQRRAVLVETLESIGSDLRLPTPEERPDFDRRLAELSWGDEPLFLIMAAITAHRCGIGYVLALDRSRLAFEVAEHELSRIVKIAESQNPRSKALARHMAAYVTLCKGITRDQAEEAAEAEARALRYTSAGDPPEIYRTLHSALPTSGADVAPVRPDVVGEAAVLLALGDGDPRKARESVARAAVMAPERVSAVIIRMVQDFGEVDGRPAEWLDCLAEGTRDTQALKRLVDQLPEETLALREIAARLTAAVVEAVRKENDKEDLAASVNNLSIRLSDLGHREEALVAGQEAVDVYRELSQSRPDAFQPDLAMSLNNLSNRLSVLGRREEALEAVQDAVAIRRNLSQSRPDAFQWELAISLNSLSNRLSELGRREEALLAAQEGLDIYRELVQSRPDELRPDLALSLNNLSNRLGDLGRHEEALVAGQEAVDVYRELSQSRPDEFRPDVALSLNNLTTRLGNLGRLEEALEAVQEAVAIRRELSRLADAFRPDLALSLYNAAFLLRILGRPGAALEASEEAVRVLLPSFQAFPAAFRDWMGQMTNMYLKLSEENGRQPDPELSQGV